MAKDQEPSPPSVSRPKDRADINSSVVVSCVSTGFYPEEITLTWWKNEEELRGSKLNIQPYGADKTYKVQSNITVQAEIDSYVTCKINHTSLDQPINSTFKINDIVKGKPSHPTISGPTKEIQQNTNVTLSCTSAGFYPPDINVTWWENEMELHGTKPEVQFDSENKTYQVQSNITVLAKEESSITCRISHTALEQPINSTFNINIMKGKLSAATNITSLKENDNV
ncbi:tyrosine-protein phosphatase non-receptor type substrate 1-like [Protopterus annectens]|uniref:tyrosine-protein phosphatase non-receptor type substrate 1-like n=1 Tax=Protopterus annectens TaxID=7888 RepID=UPI001CFC08AF|nr:tyrosine-protein phosphatase non-receptor type substrate 1-like [Protopterus annectens]